MRFLARHWKRVALAGTIVFLLVNWDSVLALVTFHYWPQSHIERLQGAVEVDGWAASGLRLKDGRTVQLPGFRELPKESFALARATSQGVEITPEGRVIGLVRVWHWCGNDALRNDVRRVDIAHLLEFMREGKFDRVIAKDEPEPFSAGGGFGDYGWNISEKILFDHFVKRDWILHSE